MPTPSKARYAAFWGVLGALLVLAFPVDGTQSAFPLPRSGGAVCQVACGRKGVDIQ